MLQIRRTLYWWGLRREARAYIRANNLRAVASAMFELDRHARLGDHRCAICRLRGALIEVLYRQGHCVDASLQRDARERPPGAVRCDEPGAACPGGPSARFTFLVEGRHYTWHQPMRALGFTPERVDRCHEAHEAYSEPTCLLPAWRDALMAVVYEYIRGQGVLPVRADWLPAAAVARRGARRAPARAHGSGSSGA